MRLKESKMSNRRNRNQSVEDQITDLESQVDASFGIVDTNIVTGEPIVTETPVKKDRKWTDEQKANLRNQWTPERRQAFSEKMKAKFESGEATGRKWTEEQK